MLKEENTLFTIGQFADLHGINKKTLMWYDEIGLLKPACIQENGYRYYSYQQSATLETILMLHSLDISTISLVQKQSRYLVSVDISADISFEKEAEQVIAETKKYQLHRLHDASYGSMLPVKHLLRGKYYEYTSLYVAMPYSVSKKGLHLQPAGTYLRAYCKGNWDKISDNYKEILAYADKQGLSFIRVCL